MRATLDRRLPTTKPEVAVLAAGTSSMGLEILAGRLVAPAFGSSIYTWGSVIGVFLAALSLGYHRGGRQAAVDASNARIVTHLLAAAGFVAFLLYAGDIVLAAAGALPLPGRFASLVPVTVLFGPPVYLLGYVTPYAAQLSERGATGHAAGHVFALGTVGSIFGAFATTFVLIPSLPVDWVGLLLGGLLVVAAVRVASPGIPRPRLASIALVAVLLVAAVAGGSASVAVAGDVVYATQTPYQELRVADSGGVRTLYLGGQRHSAMAFDDPDGHVFDYTRYFHLPLLMRDDVERVLFVGGGGFTGPKAFVSRYPGVTVDVVEIDPVVVRTAERYFGVEESERLRVHTMDGRRYLRTTDVTYDVIVLDAYKRDKVPFHLTTVEFMELAAVRLDEDGVLIANTISAPAGPGSEFYRSEYRTMARVFPQVYAFPTSHTGFVQNIELVATKDPRRITEAELNERNRERDIGIDLSREIGFYRADVPTDDVPLLRDDHAPVARLLDPLLGQRYVIEGDGGAANESAAGSAAGDGTSTSA